MPDGLMYERAAEIGATLRSSAVSTMSWYDIGMEVELIYTFSVPGEFSSIEEFERALFKQAEYERMARIIDENPELKEMYNKYKMIEILSGKE